MTLADDLEEVSTRRKRLRRQAIAHLREEQDRIEDERVKWKINSRWAGDLSDYKICRALRTLR